MNREKWKNRVIDPDDSFRPSPNSAPIGFNKSGCHRTKEKEANWKVISCGINLGPRSPLSRNRGESADAEGRSSTIIDINVVSFKGLRKSEYVWIARNYLSYSISIFFFSLLPSVPAKMALDYRSTWSLSRTAHTRALGGGRLSWVGGRWTGWDGRETLKLLVQRCLLIMTYALSGVGDCVCARPGAGLNVLQRRRRVPSSTQNADKMKGRGALSEDYWEDEGKREGDCHCAVPTWCSTHTYTRNTDEQFMFQRRLSSLVVFLFRKAQIQTHRYLKSSDFYIAQCVGQCSAWAVTKLTMSV